MVTAVLAIVMNIIKGFEFAASNKTTYCVNKDLKHDILESTSKLPLNEFDKLTSSYLIRCLNTDAPACCKKILTLIELFLISLSNIAFFIYIGFLNIYIFVFYILYTFFYGFVTISKLKFIKESEKFLIKNMMKHY